jgi:ankyrin repeat protein
MTSVLPEGAEITNISNTVKGCLRAGILQLDDGQVQSIIHQLCRHMNVISESKLLERRGQRLANCANFLRDIFEFEHAAKKPVLENRTEYEKACNRMLDQILKIPPFVSLSTQSISNLFSFVKAMDRTRRQPAEALRAAASVLVSQLQTVREEMRDADSIASMLNGLQHLAVRGLTSRGIAVGQMLSLIDKIDSKDLATWPLNSRAALMQAAVHCWADLSTWTTPLPQHRLLEVMQNLLVLPDTIAERYQYLMAVAVLMERDSNWLGHHQAILSRLMPARAGNAIGKADVLVELAQLKERESVNGKLPEPLTQSSAEPGFPGEPTTNTTTNTTTTTPTTTTLTSEIASTTTGTAAQRLPVGMTPVIDTEYRNNIANSTKKNVAKNPTNNSKVTAEVRVHSSLKGSAEEDWKSPKRAFRSIPNQVLSSTEPRLKARENSVIVAANKVDKKVAADKKTVNKGVSLTSSKSQIHQTTKTPQIGKPSKLTPEQEWFELLKQESSLSKLQFKRLQELLINAPSLVDAKEGKGNNARTALFYALSTGKPEAVRLIMYKTVTVKEDLSETLKLFFDAVELVDELKVSALTELLCMLYKNEFPKTLEQLKKKYPAGDIQKKVAVYFLKVLAKFGFMPEELAGMKESPDPIFEAVTYRQVEVVKSLVGGKSSLKHMRAIDSSGWNALMRASHKGFVEIVELLIKNDLGVQQMQATAQAGQHVLIMAAGGGNPHVMKLLLSHESGLGLISATCRFGSNALMHAVRGGHSAVVELLLSYDSDGSQCKMKDLRGLNALMHAAHFGRINIVKLLIDHPTGVEQTNAVDNEKWSALMSAARLGHTDIVELLIRQESGMQQIVAKDSKGWNALMMAAQNNKCAPVVELLMRQASCAQQMECVSDEGWNVLMIAAYNGNTDVVKLLFNHPFSEQLSTAVVDNNANEFNGLNTLMVAASRGHATTVELLLSLNSSADQLRYVNKEGSNALIVAVEKGHAAVVQVLFRHNSHVDQMKAVNKEGLNALEIARKNERNDIVDLLTNVVWNVDDIRAEPAAITDNWVNELMIAATNDDTKSAESLLIKHADDELPIYFNSNGWNTLMTAVLNKNADIVKLLMNHKSGAEQAKQVYCDGVNALMTAAMKGNTDIVKLLINHKSGAEQAKQVTNENGFNALMSAIVFQQTDVVELLINHESGAEQVTYVDKTRVSPLMYAVTNGYVDMVKLLINHKSGAEQVKHVDKTGLSALIIATEMRRADVVELLINHESGAEQAKYTHRNGSNALMNAAAAGFADIVNILINHKSGAQQATQVNNRGCNALMDAVIFRRTDVVKLLIGHPSIGEQLKAVSKKGFNAIEIAKRKGYIEIVDLLAPLM